MEHHENVEEGVTDRQTSRQTKTSSSQQQHRRLRILAWCQQTLYGMTQETGNLKSGRTSGEQSGPTAGNTSKPNSREKNTANCMQELVLHRAERDLPLRRYYYRGVNEQVNVAEQTTSTILSMCPL